jgi:hypothetical protein
MFTIVEFTSEGATLRGRLLYHPSPLFDRAAAAQRAFLVRHLM